MDDGKPRSESARHRWDVEFGELLAMQRGAFTRPQARAAGFSHYRIARRVCAGEWKVATSTVLTVTGALEDRRQADWVALLAAGPGAALAGMSAARAHDMEPPLDETCIVLPPARNVRIPGVRIRRGSVADDDFVLFDGAPATSRPRTVLDCLVQLPERQAVDYLDRALQRRWITFDELTRRVQLRAGGHGTRKLVRLIRLASGAARFEAERRLVALLSKHNIDGWECNVPIAGVGVIDVSFARLRLAIEVDGIAWHSDPTRFQNDRAKQNLLTAAGWTVLRFTWRDLVDRPDHVIATIRATSQRLEITSSGRSIKPAALSDR